MTEDQLRPYKEGYDYGLGGWNKKSKAAAFADYLAPELGINRKGVVVDKDGSCHRLHIPLLGKYWDPEVTGWSRLVGQLSHEVKKWASA